MSKSIFEINFLGFIKKNGLLVCGDRVLLAYSGGLDSSCLLHLLSVMKKKIGFEIFALYLDHNIRLRSEINAELAFVRSSCQKYGVELHERFSDIPKISRECGRSLEETARESRYNILKEAARVNGFNKIATAHHLDDSAESLMLRLVKGGSPSSFSGIGIQSGEIIRPLLFAAKADIASYATLKNITHSTDSTNSDTGYERNFVRSKIIPAIKELNENFLAKISTFQDIQRVENDFIDSAAVKFYSGGLVKVNKEFIEFGVSDFLELHLAVKRRFILYAARAFGLKSSSLNFASVNAAISFIENKNSGVECELVSGRLYIYRKNSYEPYEKYRMSGENIIISNKKRKIIRGEEISEFELDCEDTKLVSCGGFLYEFKRGFYDGELDGLCEICRGSFNFILPSGSLGKLRVKSFACGDYFKPRGMNGKTQKISDLFINEKIDRTIRKSVPLILNADGDVLAIGNIKLSEYVSAFDAKVFKNSGVNYFLLSSKDIL